MNRKTMPSVILGLLLTMPLTTFADTPLLTGQSAMGDWTTDWPGTRRVITVADLPAPYDTPSSDNGPHIVPRPKSMWPIAPPGFTIDLLTTGLTNPRKIITAPNGDLFVAESEPGR